MQRMAGRVNNQPRACTGHIDHLLIQRKCTSRPLRIGGNSVTYEELDSGDEHRAQTFDEW